MNVLVPGGCGYVGAVLVPWLLAAGHKVTVFDAMWFGRGHLPADNGKLTVIKADVRDAKAFRNACANQESIIYLASLSNNDMCEKEPDLAYAVNIEAMFDIPRIAADAGVKRFIYASSVAGYSSSDTPSKESAVLWTPTPYAAGKACAEGSLRDQHPGWTMVRSASVCGPSARMRFDTTVNMMTHDAMRRGVITVNGGAQKRSHIHIQDLCDFYRLLLDVGADRISSQVFNVVRENSTVLDSAQLVADVTGARIEVRERTDMRSYMVDGTKARELLGFVPGRTISRAVVDMKARFDSGYWKDSTTNPAYQNVVSGVL